MRIYTKRLSFRGHWVAPILAGTKTSTIRRPAKRLPEYNEFVDLITRYDSAPFARAVITSVRDVTADQLTEEDAARDGFASLAELVERLAEWDAALTAREREFYGRELLDPAPLVWRILTFELEPPT